jgi:hypothetical protein
MKESLNGNYFLQQYHESETNYERQTKTKYFKKAQV